MNWFRFDENERKNIKRKKQMKIDLRIVKKMNDLTTRF